MLVLTDPDAVTPVAGAHRTGVARRARRRIRAVRPRAGGADRRVVSRGDCLCASQRPFDAFVAVGGGSTIDTAKAVNLYTTYPPADFLDYVNPPIGKGLPVPGPLKPLIAIPTTAGTGSETTGVSIFDLKRMHAKTGIASRRLKPTLGLLDPGEHADHAAAVAASTGLDILSHAVESFTAMPYTDGRGPDRPALRPAYQGRIRSAMCGRCRRFAWWRAFSCAPWTIQSDDEAAREHAAGRVIRRHRIRQCRRPPAARRCHTPCPAT